MKNPTLRSWGVSREDWHHHPSLCSICSSTINTLHHSLRPHPFLSLLDSLLLNSSSVKSILASIWNHLVNNNNILISQREWLVQYIVSSIINVQYITSVYSRYRRIKRKMATNSRWTGFHYLSNTVHPFPSFASSSSSSSSSLTPAIRKYKSKSSSVTILFTCLLFLCQGIMIQADANRFCKCIPIRLSHSFSLSPSLSPPPLLTLLKISWQLKWLFPAKHTPSYFSFHSLSSHPSSFPHYLFSPH